MLAAVQAGARVLRAGGSALDAVIATVRGAPAFKVAKTPGCPSVGIIVALWKPASLRRSIII